MGQAFDAAQDDISPVIRALPAAAGRARSIRIRIVTSSCTGTSTKRGWRWHTRSLQGPLAQVILAILGHDGEVPGASDVCL